MAIDWIKCEHALPDKPEVVAMSERLQVDQDLIVGKLFRFWIWADQQSRDGCALSVTKAFIDRVTYQLGFGDALASVGWLVGEEGDYTIPNFERHNGKSAKKRAESAIRMQLSRSRRNESATDVAQKAQQSLHISRNERATRKEKNTGTKETGFWPLDSEHAISLALVHEPQIAPAFVRDVFDALSATEPVDGAGRAITDFGRYVATRWRNAQKQNQQPGKSGTGGSRKESVWSLEKRIAAIDADIEAARSNDAFFDAPGGIRLDSDPMNQKGKEHFAKLRAKRKELREQIKGMEEE